MQEKRKNIDLYLASSSPRRRELLRQIDLNFELISGLDVDESLRAQESPEQYVVRLAHEKARAGFLQLPSQPEKLPNTKIPVLGADTCIALDEKILGKPGSRDDGIAMLQSLSGRSHRVLTALCLFDGSQLQQCLSENVVKFKTLELDDIVSYWETGEAVDKAGAYAIQGIAAKFIMDLQGSYSGVVGLPLFELTEMLHARNN